MLSHKIKDILLCVGSLHDRSSGRGGEGKGKERWTEMGWKGARQVRVEWGGPSLQGPVTQSMS